MLSDWYKKERARKAAPRLLIWTIGAPIVGVLCVIAARWAITVSSDFLSADQSNFMVATLLMIAVPSFVFCGYCGVKLARLGRDSNLSLMGMLSRTDED
jgi:hydrogenase-4 membrane subunit HyfE